MGNEYNANMNETNLTNKEIVPAQSSAIGAYSEADREEFMFWYALPLSERRNAGFDSQSDYAIKKNIDRKTLYNWRQRPEFEPRVEKLRQQWGRDMTSAVLDGWKLSCMKGNPLSIELWLSYFHGFTRKTEIEQNIKTTLAVEDVRFLIEQLPDKLKEQNYDRLRDIIADCNAFATARDTTDSKRSSSTDGHTQAIPAKTDNVPQDIPTTGSRNVVPKNNQRHLCNDMVTEVQSSNNQSTEGRWKK